MLLTATESQPQPQNGFWDLAPHLLAIIGLDGGVHRLNPALEQLLGYTREELNERGLSAVLDQRDREAAFAAVRELAQGRRSEIELEVRVRCRRGVEHTLLGSARVCPERSLVYVAANDVTERSRIEREVSLSQELAVGIGASDRLDRALELVLRRICEETGFALGQAWMREPDVPYLEFAAAWPRDADGIEPFRSRSACMTFERTRGLPGQAWAAREPVWVDDMKAADLPRARFARDVGIGAALAVPVQAGAEIVAVLEFFTLEVRACDETVTRLVSAAAAQLGTAIVRKRAEEALRRSEERFRLLVESVADYAIVMLDRAGHVVSWNAGAERITGHTEDDILGYHVSRFYTPEAVNRGEPDRHLRAATRGRPFQDCDWRVRADGLRFRAQVTVSALFNGSTEPRGYSYVIRDVTEQHRLDEELHRLEAVVESCHDAIFSLTPRTHIVTSWNAGAERLFGHSAREMTGRPFTILVPDEHREALADALARVVDGNDLDSHELEVSRDHGARMFVELTVSPIRDARGEVTGLSAIAQDIDDRRIAEQSMKQALGTYLDGRVAEHILREGRGLCAREADVTMMFVDIRDFTAYAERFEPREVVQMLNCLFDLAVPVITQHGGQVDKFVGDGLLAVFGSRGGDRDHADCAVEAAFELAARAGKRFQGDLEIAIGIDSGSVVVGNVGGGGRLDFTVIGDAVNTASRIEAATRETGDAILISEQTRRRLWRAEIRLEERPPVRVKGKQEPITVYVPRLQREVAWTGPAKALAGER